MSRPLSPAPDIEDRIAAALMQAAGDDVPTIITKLGVTLEQVQSACAVYIGHEWEHWEGGDGVWFQSGSDFCAICGVARDYDDE